MAPGLKRLSGPARRRWRLRLAFGVVALGALYFSANFAQVWWVGRSDGARPTEAIVVLGAAQYDGTPSPQLAARLDHAAELFADGVAPVVVVTGGKQPGDRFTEAEASAAYLVEEGVPSTSVLQETTGRTSYESLDNVASLLTGRGIDDVVLVSDPFHSLRIRLIAEELGLRAATSPTRTSPVQGRAEFVKELKEAAGISLGRLIGFSRLPS